MNFQGHWHYVFFQCPIIREWMSRTPHRLLTCTLGSSPRISWVLPALRLRVILQTFSQGYAQHHHKHLLENGYFIYVVRFWVRLRKKNKEGGCGLHSSILWHITNYSKLNLTVENYSFFVWLSVSFDRKSLSQTFFKMFFFIS